MPPKSEASGLALLAAAAIATIAIGAAPVNAADTQPADIVIYGCTPAGITAAIEARHLDRTVTLICRDAHVGGMTTNGLGWADTGNHSAIGGMARQFYRDVKAYYAARGMPTQTKAQTEAHSDDLDAMWVFEPHVAEEIYEGWLSRAGVVPVRSAPLRRDGKGVTKRGSRLISLATTDGRRFAGHVFIDASYEGDLMAEARVAFTTGRESNATYGETLNGVQAAQAIHHQFDRDVDPYVIPGDRTSGLLPRIEPGPAGRDGDGDKRIQAYTYRLCMTQVAAQAAPFPKPANYDPRQYELLARYLDAGWRDLFSKYDPIPNGKTDTNNHGAFSFDDIGMNYAYPTASDAERARIAAEHRDYQQGLLWFMQNDPRSPADVRASLQKWGLCRDEFVANGHWPREMYIREARRMVTDFVMTERYLRGLEPTPDSIGLGSYNMDSHNVRRYVDARGFARNEGDIQVSPGRAYEIGYGAIVPRRKEAENLLVPVALSASHIAYGSIRMEPVFMILGQSAAAAAAIAVEEDKPVQQVPYPKLRARLLEVGQILQPKAVTLRPPSGGKGVGDYTLHDFAAKWMVQQDDIPELERYRNANLALLAEGDRRNRVVFIGDSITELWKTLESRSDDAIRWVNRGIGGSNTTQMLLRFEDDAVGLRPETVVIMGGTNDFRAYVGAPAAVVEGAIERIRRNVTAMSDIASARGIAVVLCSIPPVGRELERIARDPGGIARANSWLASFAKERGYRFVNYTAVLSDEHGFMKGELSGDGIHPNEMGYRQMMLVLEAALAEPALKRRAPAAAGLPSAAWIEVAQLRSPEISADGNVTWRYFDPEARSVKLLGEVGEHSLERDAQGLWSYAGRVEPGDYSYVFEVDGVTIPDPANKAPRIGRWWPMPGESTIHIGTRSASSARTTGEQRIAHIVYRSQAIGADRDFRVYLPPDYDAHRKQPYPVLYLLHGLSDDSGAWLSLGQVHRILDELIRSGKAKPMVVVMPTGYGIDEIGNLLSDRPAQVRNLAGFTRALLEEVMPRVERSFNVGTTADLRAIAGLSMGGMGASSVGLNHPDRFAYVGAFSPAYQMLGAGDRYSVAFPAADRRLNPMLRLFWMSCGDEDTVVGGPVESFRAFLKQREIQYQFTARHGGHEWPLWRADLGEFAQRLFRD